MRIGILTGGGDCPGLNAAIRAAALSAWNHGDEVIGVRDGWRGLLNPPLAAPLTFEEVATAHRDGGTLLGTSRTNPGKSEELMQEVIGNIEGLGLDGLIAIGGDDTLSVAVKLDQRGSSVVGVPKTIDNDVPETEFCIGFDSATKMVSDAIDTLETTVKSHRRAMVVEAMGRGAGWLAAVGGLAGGADFIVIPEEVVELDDVCEMTKAAYERRGYAIGVVAEGAHIDGLATKTPSGQIDAFGHELLVERDVGAALARGIEDRTGIETREMVLGHLQRGGSPSVFDRVLGTKFGIKAVECLHAGQSGVMVALKGQEAVAVPLQSIAGRTRGVDQHLLGVLHALGVLPPRKR